MIKQALAGQLTQITALLDLKRFSAVLALLLVFRITIGDKDSSSTMNSNYKIALLIDCDNVSHQSIEGVLQELAKYGAVNVRHAHGNWNGPNRGWRNTTTNVPMIHWKI